MKTNKFHINQKFLFYLGFKNKAFTISILFVLFSFVSNFTAFSGITNFPSVGIGLGGLSYYEPYSAFCDAVKSFRWQEVASWDENGYPTSANSGKKVLGWAGYDYGENWPIGDYTLEWTGAGDVVLYNSGAVLKSQDLTSNPKKKIYTITPGSHAVQLRIESFPATNIHVYLPGLANHTSLWNPAYVDYIKPFGVIRFMDLNDTNDSEQSNWSDRTPRNWSNYNHKNSTSSAYNPKGKVAYEAMIELANEINSDMWINLPHLCTDDYVKQLAKLIKTGYDGNVKVTEPLKPNLRVWIEFSNEIWNWGFGQTSWMRDNTEYPGTTNYMDRYAKAMHRFFTVFRTEFADNDRVVRVLATQTGYGDAYVTRERLEALPNATQDVDVIAITSYFSHDIEKYIYDNWNTIKNDKLAVINELKSRMGSGPFTSTEAESQNVNIYKQFEIAQQYGIPLVTYEGNSHIIASRDISGQKLFDRIPESVTYLAEMERMQEFADVYETWIKRYEQTGNGIFKTNVPFQLINAWSKWGQWGHMEYVGQPLNEAKKYKMLLDHYKLPYPGTELPNPVIVSPAASTVFSPGQSVTVEGTGLNLTWTVSSLAAGTIKTGVGSNVSFTVPLTAADNSKIKVQLTGGTASNEVVFNEYVVMDDLPVIITPAAQNVGVNGSISLQMTVTGNGKPMKWSGSVLSGLSISETGLLTGSFSSAGTKTVTVVVTDVDGDTDSETFAFNVTELPPCVPSFIETTGEVVMEAESFYRNTLNGDIAGSEWVKATTIAGYSGTGYMQNADNGAANGVWATAAETTYDITFQATGTYYVWLRRYNIDSSSNSVYAGVDGVQLTGTGDATYGSWGWYSPGTFTVSAAGVKTFQIRRREDGFAVDKIILTKSATAPTGSSQNESTKCITTSAFSSNNISLNVYPNPADNFIRVSNVSECDQVIIYDVLSRQQINSRIDENGQINISTLSPNIYMLQLLKNGKVILSQKLIKK